MILDPAQAAHVYRRAGFGADRERLAAAHSLDDILEDLAGRREHSALFVRGVDSVLALEEIEGLQAWWMALVLHDRAPLVERVALLWHDHFATSHDKVGDLRLMHGQVQLFRERGLGDFRELLHAVARDPAMLVWLDGNANKKGHPNENFARELFELFGLGIGHYDERDIQEAARAFSGLGVDGRRTVFRDWYHDDGIKEVLGARGAFAPEDVVNIVLEHPACAPHVARTLLVGFALPEPTAEEVSAWASVLLQEEWNIERTLERLFRSGLFLGPRCRRSRISGPVEGVATTAISLGLGGKLTPLQAARASAEMGQALYRPPNVKGWDGGRAWIHAGTWLARHNHLTRFAMAHADEVALEIHELGPWLLPDGLPPELEAALERTTHDDPEQARRSALALILTAPEYHLI